jgi:hypothetical protein
MNRAEREEPVEVSFERLIHISERAVLFEIEGSDEWLPKSQIDNLDDILEHDKATPGEVSIPRWLAIDRGWEDEE